MESKEKYALLYQAYTKEITATIPATCMEYPQFQAMLAERLKDLHCVELETEDQVGFLYYQRWEDNIAHITVPVYGYYAENEKMMVRLFRKLAEEVYTHAPIEFSIHVYRHDHACLQALHMMQFGNMAETCIKAISPAALEPLPEISIGELNKEEVAARWPEVWNAVSEIILHLTKSPVFYKGEEFTEKVYREFFMDPSVHVIAACKGAEIIGIIEWNEEKHPMITNRFTSVNVGEVFVYPAWRGTGLSQRLLQFAENEACQSGAEYMWVEHGTANPEARAFWNKTFLTYQYELIRDVVQ